MKSGETNQHPTGSVDGGPTILPNFNKQSTQIYIEATQASPSPRARSSCTDTCAFGGRPRSHVFSAHLNVSRPISYTMHVSSAIWVAQKHFPFPSNNSRIKVSYKISCTMCLWTKLMTLLPLFVPIDLAQSYFRTPTNARPNFLRYPNLRAFTSSSY